MWCPMVCLYLFGPAGLFIVPYGPTWSVMLNMGTPWHDMVLNGPMWSSIDDYCLVWLLMIQNVLMQDLEIKIMKVINTFLQNLIHILGFVKLTQLLHKFCACLK